MVIDSGDGKAMEGKVPAERDDGEVRKEGGGFNNETKR
jgi:hypothetical protein